MGVEVSATHLAAQLAGRVPRVIDVSMWLGQYPFRGIPTGSTDVVTHAIVSPFEALFWENSLDAYEQCAEKNVDSKFDIWPVVRPGAVHGLEKLLDRFHPRGLRLLPNYHNYRLFDSAAHEIMHLARERNMIVQVFSRIADERWHWMLKVPPVEIDQIEYLTASFQSQPILISGLNSLAPLASRMRQSKNLYVDISRIRGPVFAIEQIVKDIPVEQIVFGSLWPIQIIEATLWQVTTAKIEESIRAKILHENADHLLAGLMTK